MTRNIRLFLILSVEWLLLTETAFASYKETYNGYVFTFSGQNTYLKKDEAQTWCSQNGSKLLEIKSSYVQTSTVQFLSDTGIHFAEATLLFTSGVRNDGNWNWVNGQVLNITTVSEQSDSSHSFGYISSNLARLYMYIAASVPTATRGYICQGKFDCTNGLMLNGLCHKNYTSPALNWFEARYRCSSDGGDLASFDFINDDTGLNSTLYGSWFSSSTTYWIGIRRQSWIWQPSNLEVNYTNWLTGRPVYLLENRCLCLYRSGSDWKWIECTCSSVFQFVCMTEPPTTPNTSSSPTQVTTTNSTTSFNSLSLYSTTSPLYSNSVKIETPAITLGDTDYSNKRDLGIGIGVGIGGALIIAAIVIVVFLLVRKRGCPRKSNPPDVILHPLESHYAEIPKQPGYETVSTTDANYSNQSTSPVVYSDLEILTGSLPSHEKDSFSLIGSKTATLAPPNGQKGTTHFTVDGQEYAEVNKEDRT